MPRDKYFVTGNQSRLRDYDPTDKENYLASEGLISFAEKNGLYDPKQGKFDFHEAYSHDCKDADRDRFYLQLPTCLGHTKAAFALN